MNFCYCHISLSLYYIKISQQFIHSGDQKRYQAKSFHCRLSQYALYLLLRSRFILSQFYTFKSWSICLNKKLGNTINQNLSTIVQFYLFLFSQNFSFFKIQFCRSYTEKKLAKFLIIRLKSHSHIYFFYSIIYSQLFNFFSFIQKLYFSQLIMNRAILVIALLSFILAYHVDEFYSYSDFVRQFSRPEDQITKQRQLLFNQRYQQLLQLLSKGQDLQVSRYLDWTKGQIQRLFSFDPSKFKSEPSTLSLPISEALFLSPTSFDWRIYNRVTSVKDQGYCGSCWAFCSTAQIESAYAIATGGLKQDFSEQFILQCSTSNKCNGGNPLQGLRIFNRSGIPFENSYPYLSYSAYVQSRGLCNQTNLVKFPTKIANLLYAKNISNEQLQQYLISFGPLSVTLWANNSNFMNSKGMVSCPGFVKIDHAVLLVGYNSTHWFIKNSWGTQWGDGGYGYISKVAANNCGIGREAFVIQANYTAPIPPPNTTIQIQITMNDSYGDGWNSNILGLMQNDVVIATFGSTFTRGNSSGPINITIPNKLQTQIVVAKLGSYTEQVGFSVRYANGSLISDRKNGSRFTSQQIFASFCPSPPCVVNPTVDFYLTMIDSRNNGWNGTILAFRQNQTIQTFTLNSGGLSNSLKFSFNRSLTVNIIVYKLGNATNEIGYTVRTFAGVNATVRVPGATFSANQILGSFNPNSFNLNLVPLADSIEVLQRSREEVERTMEEMEEMKPQVGYKIATYILGGCLIVALVTILICAKKLVDYRKKVQGLENANQKNLVESVKSFKTENVI